MRFLLSVGILFQVCDSDVKCRNDEGNEVDWLVNNFGCGNLYIFYLCLSVSWLSNICISVWFRYILYKLPQRIDGLSYLYMDESTDGWSESRKTINSTSGTLANTLQPLFDYYVRKVTYKLMCLSCTAHCLMHNTDLDFLLQTEGFGYILYNDQPEKKASSSYGHSKGWCSNECSTLMSKK